ncbi:MAG: alpha/beta fold hydrolase, partial [Alphaproteobacteria bacterium]
QRITTTPENAYRIRDAGDQLNVEDLLSQIQAPTLVLHCRDDAVAPFEEGRKMAAMIPDTPFVALEGKNHLLLEDDPSWPIFKDHIREFLSG